MRRLRAPDVGDGGHVHAPVPSPAETWFLAARMMATHSSGISALQAQGRPGTGSCNAAWLTLRKLRRATVSPDRTLPRGIAEAGGASVRRRSETAAKEAPEKKAGGRSGEGKILLAGAVEPGARVFSSLKRRVMGDLHGLRRKRFQGCPDGSVFRCSRRHRRSSFGTLPGIGLRLKPATCRNFVDGRA